LFELLKLSPVWFIQKVTNKRVFFNEESDSVNNDENNRLVIT